MRFVAMNPKRPKWNGLHSRRGAGASVAFANVRERSQALSQGEANAQVQFHRLPTAPTSTEQPAEGSIRGDAERRAGADRGHGGVRRFAGVTAQAPRAILLPSMWEQSELSL